MIMMKLNDCKVVVVVVVVVAVVAAAAGYIAAAHISFVYTSSQCEGYQSHLPAVMKP